MVAQITATVTTTDVTTTAATAAALPDLRGGVAVPLMCAQHKDQSKTAPSINRALDNRAGAGAAPDQQWDGAARTAV
jgi:hypothetical protein